MKITAALLTLLIYLSTSYAQTTVISQPLIGSGWFSTNNTAAQSFTITQPGTITEIRFHCDAADGLTLFELREGQDIAGTLLYSTTISINGSGWVTVSIPSVPVCYGLYCFTLSDYQWGTINDTNPYSGGQIYKDGNWVPFFDMAFEVDEILASGPFTPVPDASSLTTVSVECALNTITIPTATSFCSGSINGVSNVSLPISTIGTTIITWTYDDGFGNVTTQTQEVIVTDNAAPVPDAGSLADLEGICEPVAAPTPPTATDNCEGSITGTTTTTFPVTTEGTTAVTWTFDDGNGNVSTQTQDIIVSGVDVGVTQSGTLLTSNDPAATYQWIDCNTNDPISGETSASFEVTANGSYAVIVTDGTCSDTSNCIEILNVGLDEVNSETMVLYPNPTANGYFNIQFDGMVSTTQVLDVLGRPMNVTTSSNNKIVDASALRAGKYFVRIVSKSKYFVKEISILE